MQAIRTIYGDGLLVNKANKQQNTEKNDLEESRRRNAAELALLDLTTAINLLTEKSMGKLFSKIQLLFRSYACFLCLLS